MPSIPKLISLCRSLTDSMATNNRCQWRGLVKGVVKLLRLGVKVSLVSNQPSDTDVDSLNSHFLESPAWVGDRSSAFHQWRFYDGPRFIYRVRYAFSNNELVGYLVARIADFEGMRAAVILDCVVRPGSSSRVSRALIADAVNWALLEKADLVATLSYGSSPSSNTIRTSATKLVFGSVRVRRTSP